MNSYDINTAVDILWERFKLICNACLDLIPSKVSSTRFNQPWITRNIKSLSRRKQRFYNRAKALNTPEAWVKYKELKRLIQHQCRKAYNHFIANLTDANKSGNSKKFWSFIKSKRKDQCEIPPLVYNGVTHTDDLTKANILNNQFTSVFTNENTLYIPKLQGVPYPIIQSIQIHQDGVTQLMQQLDYSKAYGPDKIPGRLLKETANELSPPLTLIFQASLKQGQLPNDWKHANITPVFKKGARSAPANYRPISLTCICCKILEHIVSSSIYAHLEENKILSDVQHGFRKKRSCETQLIITIDDFAQIINNTGGQADVILLDFSKAFDKVPHNRLCEKLAFYGIRGPLLTWIRNFITNRTQRVILNGRSSQLSNVLSGVPQGTVLGPLLFLCYINDLPKNITSRVKLYADDVLLYSPVTTTTDCQSLQKDLERLVQWADKWQMSFNLTKCEMIRITNRRNPVYYTYKIKDHCLNEVLHTKYLGVFIDKELTWSKHIDYIASKANQALAFLQRNLISCPTQVKINCYKSFVCPIMDYCSTVWSPYTLRNIKKLKLFKDVQQGLC